MGLFVLLVCYLLLYPSYGVALQESSWVKGFIISVIGFGIGYGWWRGREVRAWNALLYILCLLMGGAMSVLLFLSPANFLGETSVVTFFSFSVVHLLVTVVGILILGCWCVGIGSLFTKIEKGNEIAHQIWSFVLGASLLSFLGLCLARFGWFSLSIWVGIFMGSGVLLFSFWRDLWRTMCSFSYRLNPREHFFIAFVGSIFSVNFLQGALPFSLGWDASNQYLLTVETLLNQGVLRSSVFPPFGELLSSLVGFVGGVASVNLLLVLLGGILPWGIYVFLRSQRVESRMAIVLALLFFMIPALQFQMSQDVKFDIYILWGALGALYLWKQNYRYQSLWIWGCMPLVKLTTFWFFPVLILWVLVSGWKDRSFKSVFCSGVVLVLPFCIWVGTNVIDSLQGDHQRYATMGFWLSGSDGRPTLKLPEQEVGIGSDAIPVNTGYKEEVERYSGFSSNIFTKAWHVFKATEIPTFSRQFVDLSFWWLGLVIMLCSTAWWIRHKAYFFELSLGLSFVVLWLLMGEGIGWYVLPGLLCLCLSSTQYVNGYLKGKELKVLAGLGLIAIVLGVMMRWSSFSLISAQSTISWWAFPSGENRERLSRLFFDEERSVARILNADKEALVLRVGTMTRFWVEGADERFIEDSQLDVVAGIMVRLTDERVIPYLISQGVEYVLIDRGTTSIEKDKNGTLHQKFKKLEVVLRKSDSSEVSILFQGERIILIKLSR